MFVSFNGFSATRVTPIPFGPSWKNYSCSLKCALQKSVHTLPYYSRFFLFEVQISWVCNYFLTILAGSWPAYWLWREIEYVIAVLIEYSVLFIEVIYVEIISLTMFHSWMQVSIISLHSIISTHSLQCIHSTFSIEISFQRDRNWHRNISSGWRQYLPLTVAHSVVLVFHVKLFIQQHQKCNIRRLIGINHWNYVQSPFSRLRLQREKKRCIFIYEIIFW